MLMMRPPRRPMARAAAWLQKNGARRFTASRRSNWAGVVVSTGVRKKSAALLTRTSRRPSRFTARGHEAARLAGAAHVGAQRHRAHAARLEVAHRRARRRRGAQVADRHVGARVGERARDLESDAHRAAGDERDPTGQFLDLSGAVWCHRSNMSGSFRNWVKTRFITGLFSTVPAIATAWLLWVFWNAIDDFFSPVYTQMFGRRIPGLGFLTAVVIIFIMGTIARNVVGRRVLARIEMLFDHVPIFRSIYPSVKQLLESFSPQKLNSFKSVVLAEHPRKGEYVFGFVTSEVLVEGLEGKRAMVTVFVPTNNLYLGDVIVVPKDEMLPTGLTVEEGIRIILSAGTATPPRLPRERL